MVSGSVVDLKEMIQSREAHKILDAMAESPDLVQAVFDLITEVTANPNTVNHLLTKNKYLISA